MGNETTLTFDAMPEDVRREYGNILERLDANALMYPDPFYAADWARRAEAQLQMPEQYFGGLLDTEQRKVRNQTLANLVAEAFAERKMRDPSEDDTTAWHLAVKRGIEGYFAYDKARLADLDRGASDAWGSLDAHLPGFLASREAIFTDDVWQPLVAVDRENHSQLFFAHAALEAQRTRPAAPEPRRDAPAPSDEPQGPPSEEQVRAAGADWAAKPFDDPAAQTWYEGRLAEVRAQMADVARPPAHGVFARFAGAAGLPADAVWADLSDDERTRFAGLAAPQIANEYFYLYDKTGPARPEGVDRSAHQAALREQSIVDALAYYRSGVRGELESDAAKLGSTEPAHSPVAADRGTRVTAPAREAGSSWTDGFRMRPDWEVEAAAVDRALAARGEEADRVLASFKSARGARYDTIVGARRGPELAGFGAWQLSKSVATGTAVGEPPTAHTLEDVLASPRLQYEIARAHVRTLLEDDRIKGLSGPERAGAIATAYRFGVERLGRAPDAWASEVVARLRTDLTREDVAAGRAAPAPARPAEPARAPAAEGAVSVAIPTIAEAAPYRDAVLERARARGVTYSEGQLLDQQRAEGFYRNLLVARGVADPRVVRELERAHPDADGRYAPAGGESSRIDVHVLDSVFRRGRATFTAEQAKRFGFDLAVIDRDIKAAEAAVAAAPDGARAKAATPAFDAGRVAAALSTYAERGGFGAEDVAVAKALDRWLRQDALRDRTAEMAAALDGLEGAALLKAARTLVSTVEAGPRQKGYRSFADVRAEVAGEVSREAPAVEVPAPPVTTREVPAGAAPAGSARAEPSREQGLVMG